MKIVLDTNLLVAMHFNKRSSSRKIFDLAGEGKVSVMWSEAVRKEADFILGRILRAVRKPEAKKEIFERLFHPDNFVVDPPKVDVVKEDPDDNKFLGCALGGEVDYVVSNDRHLLDLVEFEGISIVRPGEILKLLG